MVIIFVELGQELQVTGGSLESFESGVRQGYKRAI